MNTFFFSHKSFLDHNKGLDHPENSSRLEAILNAVGKKEINNLKKIEAPKIDTQNILLAHSAQHMENVFSHIPESGYTSLDSDTFVSQKSKEASLRSAGAITAAIDSVFEQKCKNAFCAVRPPGHHAEFDRSMGFCLFNNVAIGGLYARKKYGLNKIAVIDFDVHHGNGTQNIFSGDKDFLYASTHQFPFYPGTGSLNENVDKHIVNAPLKAYSGSLEFREAMEKHIFPNINKFNPELILISAGFDAHKDDPLGQLNLDEKDFIWVTNEIKLIAEKLCDNRLVSILEGGYNISALSSCVLEHIKVLAK